MRPISGANMRKSEPVIISKTVNDVSEQDNRQIRSDK
jgi:hypothetical protein